MIRLKPFTLFIPVLDEELLLVENTERLIGYLGELGTGYEIILGSNGSTDRTPLLGANLEKRFPGRVKFFHLNEKGVGLAFRRGVEVASYDHIICVDMDLSVDLRFIREAAELLEEFDVVIGAKKAGGQMRPRLRRMGSIPYILCSKILLGLSFDDYSPAAKAYRTSVIKKYMEHIDSGTSFATYILYFAHRDGARMTQVPVWCNDMRQSKFNLFQLGVHMYKNLFRLWWLARSKGIRKR